MINTVFSVDDSVYQRWQADLLAYSHKKVRQPGKLTRLWSSTKPPTPFEGDTVAVEPFATHPETGDYYPPYNKPTAIRQWLDRHGIEDETVLLIDPDFVFNTPITEEVEPGKPRGQRFFYVAGIRAKQVIGRYHHSPTISQPIGVPILIHRSDLAVLLPQWISYTERIRQDKNSGSYAMAVAEMFGYVLSALENRVFHRLGDLGAFSFEDRIDLPLIHYPLPVRTPDRTRMWFKGTYRPWDVPDIDDAYPAATKHVLSLLRELAERQTEDIPVPDEEKERLQKMVEFYVPEIRVGTENQG
jgi:hypothetical protein